MKILNRTYLIVLALILSFSIGCLAQNNAADSSFAQNYDDETDKTTVLLKAVKLPNNKEGFSIGAFFEYKGEKMIKTPCCAKIFFTSIGKKKFKFKEDHNLTIWADGEKFSFDDVAWQESAEGTAFITAGIAFPEELIAGMKSEIFLKIANAVKVKMQLGGFTFNLTPKYQKGLKKLSERMKIEGR